MTKNKYNTVIDKNTFYFNNPDFQEENERYINSITETLLILKNNVDTNGLRKDDFEQFLLEKDNALRALLALTGFANESFKRLITVVRISKNRELSKLLYKSKWQDKSEDELSEWGDNKINNLIKNNKYFRKAIVNLFFEGASLTYLAKTLPLFELKKLSISKLKFDTNALIDSLVRHSEFKKERWEKRK